MCWSGVQDPLPGAVPFDKNTSRHGQAPNAGNGAFTRRWNQYSLSILLSRHFGIAGVALGTAIPLTVTSVFFPPRHLCHELDITLRTFLTQAYFLLLTLCVPLVRVVLSMRKEVPAHHYGFLVIQVACSGLLLCRIRLALALLAPRRPAGIKLWEALIRGV